MERLLVTPPHDVAEELNKRFPMEDQGELYFTMFYGVFNRKTGLLQYVSAGHVPPVLFRKNGKPEILPAEGFAIGWIDGIDYDLEQVTLEPGIAYSYFPMVYPRQWIKTLMSSATSECSSRLRQQGSYLSKNRSHM